MWQTDWPLSTSPFKPDPQRGLHSPPDGTVGIVIPVRDGLPFFKLAFHSILSFTDHPFMLVIVDNQSGIKTKGYLRQLEKNHPISVLRYDKEFNYGAEINLGINYLFRFPAVKYGLAFNADAVAEPNWLSTMIRAIKTKDRIGIVGPVTNVAIPDQEFPKSDKLNEVGWVSGFCMMFKRKVFEDVGGFDESFVGGCFEDRDFCERARPFGWASYVNTGTHIHHFGHGFRERDTETQDRAFENKKRFFDKHPELKSPDKEALML